MRNSCGHQVAKTQKFCPECGAPVVTPSESGPRVESFSARKIRLQVDCKINIMPTNSVGTIVVTITGDEEVKADILMSVVDDILTITQPESDGVTVESNDYVTVIRGRGNIVVGNISGLAIVSGSVSSSRPPNIEIACPVGTQVDIDTTEIRGKIGDLQSVVTFNTGGDCTLKLGQTKGLSGRTGGDLNIETTQIGKADLTSGGNTELTADLVQAAQINAGGDASATISNGHDVAVEAGGDCQLSCYNVFGQASAEAGGDLKVNLNGGTLDQLTLRAGGDVDCKVTAQCQNATIRAGGDVAGTLNATRHKVRAGGDNDLEIN